MIDARVLGFRPHPDQATTNPGCWAVQLEVTHDQIRRTFWRWHTVRQDRQLGGGGSIYVTPSNDRKPTHAEILAQFWTDTFGELHGFDFEDAAP